MDGPYAASMCQARSRRSIEREEPSTPSSLISMGGNFYSVPDGTRRRPVEVQVTATEVHILEDGRLIAAHPVLEGRGRRRIAVGHRSLPPPHNSNTPRAGSTDSPSTATAAAGVAPRSLAIYEAVGRRLATGEAVR